MTSILPRAEVFLDEGDGLGFSKYENLEILDITSLLNRRKFFLTKG